jgi:ribosomal protein L18E
MAKGNEEQSLLVGKRVSYSKTKHEIFQGRVLDKIEKFEKPGDTVAVTGYIIEDELTSELVHVSYWRVLKVLPEVPKGGHKRGFEGV